MARYQIGNLEVDSSDPAFPAALAQAYHSPNLEEVRPRCLCRRSEPGHERDEASRCTSRVTGRATCASGCRTVPRSTQPSAIPTSCLPR